MFLKFFLLFAAAAGTIPWSENNFPHALAAAKAHHLPLFVEVWAPW